MEKSEAVKKAQALADRLNKHFNTDQWVPHVWYNMMWCYNATIGSVSVAETIGGEYHALVSTEKGKPGGGLTAWTGHDINSFAHPANAVVYAVMNSVDYVNKLNETVQDNIDKLKIVTSRRYDSNSKIS